MKTFKHKKTGEIATYKDGVLKSSGFCVEIGTEPSSEFWEEVIEKNYEILKISGYTLRDNGKYSHHKSQSKIGVITAEKLLSSDRYSYYIKTVKRLSDGEIFTVGDKIMYNETPLKIKKIFIDSKNYKLRIISENYRSQAPVIFFGINYLIKYKQPFFTTEDGVDIYEGDTIFSVESSLNEINLKVAGNYKKSTKNHPVKHWYNDDKYFSTKEKAEEYILMNKPCLSINDVLSIGQRIIVDEGKLKKLVKSKL